MTTMSSGANDTVKTFDPVWENEIYSQGHQLNRYPYDTVVSYVFRNAPRDRPRSDVRILEIGCGAGNNLWFAAREGFRVAGIDGSASAIRYAKERFAKDGLEGDLRVGDFTSLPFESGTFDLAIERGALVCCGRTGAAKAVGEVRRVLREGGRLFLNPYSDAHTSASSGRPGADGVTVEISGGSLVGMGQLCFYGRGDVEALFEEGWNVDSLMHTEAVELRGNARHVHAEWRVLATKRTGAG